MWGSNQGDILIIIHFFFVVLSLELRPTLLTILLDFFWGGQQQQLSAHSSQSGFNGHQFLCSIHRPKYYSGWLAIHRWTALIIWCRGCDCGAFERALINGRILDRVVCGAPGGSGGDYWPSGFVRVPRPELCLLQERPKRGIMRPPCDHFTMIFGRVFVDMTLVSIDGSLDSAMLLIGPRRLKDGDSDGERDREKNQLNDRQFVHGSLWFSYSMHWNRWLKISSKMALKLFYFDGTWLGVRLFIITCLSGISFFLRPPK